MKAIEISKTLIQIGYKVIEITFTIPMAEKVIDTLKEEAVIGAGTVLTIEQAKMSIEAGAQFIVSPVFDKEIIKLTKKNKIITCAGAVTPTEIHQAFKNRVDIIKIFPVSHLGGVDYLKTIRSIFKNIILLPTGGITDQNCIDYLNAGADLLGIGNWLVDDKKDLTTIKERGMILLNKVKEWKT